MKIISQSYEILSPLAGCECGRDSEELLNKGFVQEAKLIELAGRTAYKSEDKISDVSYDAFIRGLIKRKQEALIEFGSMAVKFVTDRGISHELVRHRLASFCQESTRYCSYVDDKFGGEITVIKPSTWGAWPPRKQYVWEGSMERAESQYMDLIGHSEKPLSPQQARAVLPNSLKTEIVVRANFREWRHIFKLRCAKTAHPDMRALVTPLRDECARLLPCVFDDLEETSNE
jgi:thymidylate synthase (FAD)